MQEILILNPLFKERIWGGNQLERVFGYSIPSDRTGECWGIAAHPHGDCEIANGVFKGWTLSEVYDRHRELFGHCPYPRFPLLVKILDARTDLSVQVHPDDSYALEHANDLGKTECWYIIDCKPETTLIYGHHAKTKAELSAMIENHEWDRLLRKVEIHPGDFFYVPTGTLHALCADTLVLEVQQSSDTTYRVYDYDRVDDEGKKRPLHLQEAMEVLTVPHRDPVLTIERTDRAPHVFTRYIKSPFFTVEKWDIAGTYSHQPNSFLLMTVLAGQGSVNGIPIQKGHFFIVTSACQSLTLMGQLELIVTFL